MRRSHAAVALALSLASTLGAPPLATADVSGPQGMTRSVVDPQGPAWDVRDASTRLPVEAFLGAGMGAAAVGGDASIRGVVSRGIVAVRKVAGHPEVVRVPIRNPLQLRAAVTRLQADPAVLSLGVDRQRRVVSAVRSAAAPAAPRCDNPTDSSAQWDYDALGLGTLHSSGVTGAGATVAVIDSGVNGNTPQLRGQVLSGTDLVGRGNGWNDLVGHGTHVAGTVAAMGNGGGVSGVAPRSKVLPVRVADATGFAWDSDTAGGIRYAVSRGVQVMNLSLAGTVDPTVATMIRYAQSRGILVVAAAGNERDQGNPVRYPGAYPGVLAVGATGRDGGPTYFSEAHPYVRIAAPGWDITSTFPTGPSAPTGLCVNSGTSMASPHVAGVAALLYQATAGKVRGASAAAFLMGTTRASGMSGYDISTGFGVVNPSAAVAAARCWVARRCGVPLANVRDNAAQRWVQRAQVQLAGRSPSTRDLLNWPAWVRSGHRSGAQLAGTLVSTPGYRQHAARSYLKQTVGRTGPAASVNHYAGLLARGQTEQQLYATLLASSEAYRRAGNTNAGWVRYAYRTAMGAEPSAAALRLHTGQLGRGTTRATIAARFVGSSYGLGRIVDAQFQQYLGHGPTTALRTYWVGRLQRRLPVGSLAANLVGGSEYRSRS